MNKSVLLKPDDSPKPPYRRLRAYAFDPSLSLKIDTADINDMVYKVPWEELTPGPAGEYIQLIDYDPYAKAFYKPIDLDDKFVLAKDGFDPSESSPKFHQQMVYAVVMTTIKNFERALGRKILWAPRRLSGSNQYEEYVQQLRIYPHAMREANAYYSPLKKALLFGYFSSTPADQALQMPDSLVFTCLSHDIIAHEVTHAILDGIHSFYNEPTNPDVLAFHEAFADLVALFQHFTFPEVLKHQIAKTRGELASQNLLGQLAQEFGTAIGNYGSLRDAIGEIDTATGKWKMHEPSADDYKTIMEPHARGSILVAAVFEAFISIYKNRVADLLHIASNGTGILVQGELQPDLVNRMAKEASKAARHVLDMCIRALDLCPPTDITFGDYLRAIITADLDLVPDDTRDYRLAFIDAFRKRGIYPEGIKTLSVESLAQPKVRIVGTGIDNEIISGLATDEWTKEMLKTISEFLKEYANEIKYINKREDIFNITKAYIGGSAGNSDIGKTIRGLHDRINTKFSQSTEFERITGLAFIENPESIGVRRSKKHSGPSYQILNLRLVSRIGPANNQINYVLFSMIQRSGVVFKDGKFKEHYIPPSQSDTEAQIPEGGFEFRGGCTLIFDLDSLQLKYAISKPLLDIEDKHNLDGKPKNEQFDLHIDFNRASRQNEYMSDIEGKNFNEYTKYFSTNILQIVEPFNFLHQ